MKTFIVACSLFLPVAAMAQAPDQFRQQIDSETADVNAVIAQFRSQLLQDRTAILALSQQIAALTKERDDLKAKETKAEAAPVTAKP